MVGLSLAACLMFLAGCDSETTGDTRVIVLGIDGMDYDLTRQLMAEGRLPNFSRLAEQGTFSALGTSIPPLSPVAWSDFITGTDAGGHGIFDFIHRDPKTMIPYLSTSRSEAPETNIEIGNWRLPLSAAKVELLRQGKPFWEALEEEGIETTICRIPANFPPSGTATRELSGMGTPDILGGYGTYSFYSTKAKRQEDHGSGSTYPINVHENVVRSALWGPPHPFLIDGRRLSTLFTLYLDPEEPVLKLEIGDEERILDEGEWSDWVPVEFPFVPTQSLPGMCRFHVRSIRPELEIYVTPVNFDPEAPALPISTPSSYARELAAANGRFYTQGMPEDTNALSEGVLTTEEFLAQADIAAKEVTDQYPHVLDGFQDGLLFYYVGNLDQVSHLMWRPLDPDHPAYDPQVDSAFQDVVPALYDAADEIVGYTLDQMGEGTTLIVMSDHGFTSWRRTFHLNAWLWKNGYLGVKDPDPAADPSVLLNVDWSRTRAYGLGLNGLYINLQGRERDGIVPAANRHALADEIAQKLLGVIDPATGKPAITKVYHSERDYEDLGQRDSGPDLVVGYAKMTRCSEESALGQVVGDVLTDNTEPWSGDHCMDHETVPGILVTNHPLKREAASLKDLAASILAEFEVDGFPPQDD